MASAAKISAVLICLYLFPSLSTAVEQGSVNRAADVLGGSGFIAMSLTLGLVENQLSSASFSTIFCPSDDAFALAGQPSFAVLQLHFSPVALSFQELQSLPFGTKIPSLSPGRWLTVTTLSSGGGVLIDNVKVDGSPMYDDGNLIVYAVEEFFKLDLDESSSPSPKISPNWNPRFTEAGWRLESEGYSIVAAFLEMQLAGLEDVRALTVFAPADGSLKNVSADFRVLVSIFLSHVVPCFLPLSELAGSDRISLATLNAAGGSPLNVTRSGNLFRVNGLPLLFPDLYRRGNVIVYGLQGVAMPEGLAGPPERAIGGSY